MHGARLAGVALRPKTETRRHATYAAKEQYQPFQIGLSGMSAAATAERGSRKDHELPFRRKPLQDKDIRQCETKRFTFSDILRFSRIPN